MNEEIIFDGKCDPKAYKGTFLFLICLTLLTFGFGLVFTLPMVIWVWIEIKTTHYKFTSERIQIETGLFSTTVETTDLWRVRDLKFQRGLLEKMTDGCTILLVTQDLTTPNIRIKCFTAKHGREIFEKLQPAISNARKTNKTISLTA